MQQSRSPEVSHWLINQFNKLAINEKGLHLINGANTFKFDTMFPGSQPPRQ